MVRGNLQTDVPAQQGGGSAFGCDEEGSRDLIVGQTVAQKPMPRAKYGLGDWCETLSVGNELCRVVG